MSKFIRIEFSSARLPFFYNYYSKNMDKIANQMMNTLSNRPENQMISSKECGNIFGTTKNLIHFEQVSNMLHVLIGERPVSSFNTPEIDGAVIRERSKLIDDIAKNGFFRLNSTYLYKDKDKEKVITETTKFKKGCKSNVQGFEDGKFYKNKDGKPTANKSAFISWRKFHLHFFDIPEEEELVKEVIGKYTSKPFDEEHYTNVNEAVNEVEKNGLIDAFLEDAENKGVKGLVSLFKSQASFLRPRKTHRFAMMSANGFPSLTICLDGEFVFEVPDDIYDRIFTGTKCATFLDGGAAILRKWEGDNSYFSMDDEDEMKIFLEENNFERISDKDIR